MARCDGKQDLAKVFQENVCPRIRSLVKESVVMKKNIKRCSNTR